MKWPTSLPTMPGMPGDVLVTFEGYRFKMNADGVWEEVPVEVARQH